MQTTRAGRSSGISLGVLLALWAAGVTVVSSMLLAGHVLALPEPEGGVGNPRVEAAMLGLRARSGDVVAAHVLLASCGCSKRVLDHLAERRPHPGVTEHVVLVGGTSDDAEWSKRLRETGFSVEEIPVEALPARMGLEAAPVLVVLGVDGKLAYVGGYTDRKQGPVIHDVEILESAMSGRTARALALFGCAVSQRMRAAFDPLGLKR